MVSWLSCCTSHHRVNYVPAPWPQSPCVYPFLQNGSTNPICPTRSKCPCPNAKFCLLQGAETTDNKALSHYSLRSFLGERLWTIGGAYVIITGKKSRWVEQGANQSRHFWSPSDSGNQESRVSNVNSIPILPADPCNFSSYGESRTAIEVFFLTLRMDFKDSEPHCKGTGRWDYPGMQWLLVGRFWRIL